MTYYYKGSKETPIYIYVYQRAILVLVKKLFIVVKN